MSNRVFELWVGLQASGKTYQLKKRIAALAQRRTIRGVFVVDRLGEYGDVGDVFANWGAFVDEAREGIPRVAVFQFGLDPARYNAVYEFAEFEGDCALVIDEARAVAPSGAAWKGGVSLERIALAGRHLLNCKGELRPTHLLIATQYPRSIHISLREQARTVMCGQLVGELALDWVRGEFGAEALARVQRLSPHEWTCVFGKDPR